MRATILLLCLAAAACGQAQNTTPAAPPNLEAAAYRAEAEVLDPDGKASTFVMYRDHGKIRMEFPAESGGMVMILNPETKESIMLTTTDGKQTAIRSQSENVPDVTQEWQTELASHATRLGACTAAGLNGDLWQSAAEEEGGAAKTACITSDGIVLEAKDGDRVTWRTTSIQRGAQDPALFMLPPGVEVFDPSAMFTPEMREQMERMAKEMQESTN